MGRGALWNDELPECIHQNHIFRVRLDLTRFSPEFVAAEIASPYGKSYFLAHAKQTTGIATINQRVLSAFRLVAPDLPEQERIVWRLARQFAALERARAAATVRLEAAKGLPAAYLRARFNDSLPWPRRRLGDVLTLRKEIVHPRDNPSGQAIFVGLEHLESGTGRRIGAIEVEQARLTGRKPCFFRGDIVYGYLRPYLNKVWVAEFDGLCSVDQYVFSADRTRADSDFVAWFMRSQLYLHRAPIGLTPGQLPRVRTEEVASVDIELPSLPKQRNIVASLRERMASAEKALGAIEQELHAIEALPAALLRRALTGQL